MIIRSITPQDLPAWERMRGLLWPRHSHGGEIAAFISGTLAEPEAVLVAEDMAGATVAFVELSIRRDLAGTGEKPTGYVEGLYVEEQYRGRGIARQLLRAAQQWSREKHRAFFASDRDDRVVFDKGYH